VYSIILQHCGRKILSNGQRKKEYTYLSTELWIIFHYNYNEDYSPAALAIPGLGTGKV
jgi:hypothetical protein